jgi:quinol-cytochrome oxidoreductase complex cytochrome b subunit
MDKLITWIDERLPVSNFVKNHLSQYYAPKNFNFFYYFGALAIFIFILQIVTGIFLTINYKPDAASAVRLCRIHNERCGMGLANSILTLDWRIFLFCCYLSSYV